MLLGIKKASNNIIPVFILLIQKMKKLIRSESGDIILELKSRTRELLGINIEKQKQYLP